MNLSLGHNDPQNIGGDYMGGSYQYHAPAKRYYVSIYWQSKRYKVWRYNGEPIWHKKTAEKLLNKIRAEVDSGTLNIKAYLPDSPVSLTALSEAWLNASTVCKNTKRVYRTDINRAVKYFGAKFDIRTFTYSKLQIYYNEIQLSEKGKYNALNTIKTMLNFAYKDELIGKVPPFPKMGLGLPQEIEYLTYDQQQKVLDFILPHQQPIFEFMMEYGLRIGEATALMRDCITDDKVIIRRSHSNGELRETTKTGITRIYGLTDKAKEILTSATLIAPFSPWAFNRDGSGKNYTLKVVDRIWREACNKAGITIKLYNAVRHSLGCQLLDQGVDMEMVRDVYGHSTTQMTRRYAKRSQHTVTAVLNIRGRLEDNQRTKIEGGN